MSLTSLCNDVLGFILTYLTLNDVDQFTLVKSINTKHVIREIINRMKNGKD